MPYFHVVFTLPHQLNPLCQRHPRLLYDLLFRATAQTMLEVAANPRHLGAKIGFLAILHTWGQNLRLHPHLHCVVPAGGFDPTCSHWVHPRHPFFLPVKVLSRVFRGKFLDFLQQSHATNFPAWTPPSYAACFARTGSSMPSLLLGRPERVLRYLGRYTHRVAISNQRLLSFDGHNVSFRWRDYAHGNKQRIMTLTATEFLRRFCQHVLPRGFVRIRHFGYLASAHRTALARTRSPSPEKPTTARSSHRESPASYLALPALRSQHAYRAQPNLATTGLSMQTARLFLTSSPSAIARATCSATSSPTCASTRKWRLNHLISCLLRDRETGPSASDHLSDRPLPVRVRGPLAAFPETYLALGSIAAPTTATAFLLVSLSKMPRSILSTLRILPRGISDQG